MFKHIKNNKGFTLIELLIVVAVIGILAAIAVPSFTTYRAKAKITGADAVLSGVYTEVKVLEAEGGILSNSNQPANDATAADSTLDFENDTVGTKKVNAPNGYANVGFHGSSSLTTVKADTGTNCDYVSTTDWKIGALSKDKGDVLHRFVDQTKAFADGSANPVLSNDADACVQ